MEEPSKPNAEEGPKIHEPKREKVKGFGKNWLIGMTVLALFSIIGEVGNSLGIESINIRTISSPADILSLATHISPLTALFVFFAAAGVGAVTFLIVSSSDAYGKLVRLHNASEITERELNDRIKKDIRKFRIIPLAVWMILVAIIVMPVVGGVFVVSGIDTSNSHDLLHAYVGGHIFTIIAVIIGGAVVGWLTTHLKKQYYSIYDTIEPYVKRTRVL